MKTKAEISPESYFKFHHHVSNDDRGTEMQKNKTITVYTKKTNQKRIYTTLLTFEICHCCHG